MPCHTAPEAVLRIVHAIHQFGNFRGRRHCLAAFEIQESDGEVHIVGGVAEHPAPGGGEDDAVVLGHNVADCGQMGGIVEDDGLFAIVHVQIVGADMLSQDEAVAESLDGHVAEDLVVILIAGGMEADGLAGVGLEGFPEMGVADILVQAELGILHDQSGDIFEEGG